MPLGIAKQISTNGISRAINTIMYHFFTNKTVLVVDDFAEFRLSVKGMVEKFGAQMIDTAKDGDEAVQAYVKSQHDIVLCDYNLGEGKNGQQVLEELHHREVFRYDTTFILVTAERTIAMVMGALEFKPDDYLTKPFTQTTLRTRLIRVAQQKQDLKSIYTAITAKNYQKAIAACEAYIKQGERYSGLCRQLVAECHLRLNQPDKSRAIYSEMLAQRPTPAAILGVAKSLLAINDIAECEKTLNALLKIQPKSVEAMDLMAEIKRRQEKPEQEKHWLKQASQLSPLSITRQRKLAEVSKATNDDELELRSLRHISKLSQHSSKCNPDDAAAYIQAALKKASSEQGLKRKRLLAEAVDTLKQDQKRYKTEPRFQTQAELLELQSQIIIGGSKVAERLSQNQEQHEATALKQGDGIALRIMEDNYRLLGNENQANALRSQAIAMAKQQQKKEAEAAKAPANQLGITAYKANQFGEAIKQFRVAIQEFPDSVTIALNLVQALLKWIKTQDGQQRQLDEAKELIARIAYLPANDNRYERLHQLKRHIDTLEIQYEQNRSAN